MFGVFGYELDPTAMTTPSEIEIVRHQVAFYVERRDLFQYGRFLRLRSPVRGRRQRDGVDGRGAATARAAVAAHYRVLQRPIPVRDRLRLRGLDPAARYEVTAWDGVRRADGEASSAGATS